MRPTTASISTIDTPDGPFSLICTDTAVLAAGWTTEAEYLRALIHRDLRPTLVASERDYSGTATAAIADYYDGNLEALTSVDVQYASGPFRETAWHQLRTIKAGDSLSYTELAERCGNIRAARAAASACAANPIALLVPCHRIIATNGSIGGYRYGTQLKGRLWEREHRS